MKFPIPSRPLAFGELVRRLTCLAAFGCLVGAGSDRLEAEEPIGLRFESFLVAPAHTPSAVVVAKNHAKTACEGTVRVNGPEGWQISPAEQSVGLAPGQSKRVVFLVKKGRIRESNRYRLEATFTCPRATVVHAQEVVTASAPYFKPTIDGQIDDWADAIPITWSTGGRKTTISTYWNRRQFSLLVAVEEDDLRPFREEPGPAGFDAVQLAISPQGSKTGTSPDDASARFEFLFAATGKPAASGEGTQGKCFLLSEPGNPLASTQTVRPLLPLAYEKAKVAVARREGITYYECSIPFRLMRDRIRPSEGREFQFSVLVHDPGGTGIRDWGQEAGLGPCRRSRLAWSQWPGAKWEEHPPFDSKTPWGLCSSKY